MWPVVHIVVSNASFMALAHRQEKETLSTTFEARAKLQTTPGHLYTGLACFLRSMQETKYVTRGWATSTSQNTGFSSRGNGTLGPHLRYSTGGITLHAHLVYFELFDDVPKYRE